MDKAIRACASRSTVGGKAGGEGKGFGLVEGLSYPRPLRPLEYTGLILLDHPYQTGIYCNYSTRPSISD